MKSESTKNVVDLHSLLQAYSQLILPKGYHIFLTDSALSHRL
jgi:hypothetical protein